MGRASLLGWMLTLSCVVSSGSSPEGNLLHGPQALEQVDRAGMELSIVESMMDREHYFAALAHLDALDSPVGGSPRARWLRAEALRRTGRASAAAEVYQKLLGTDWAGPAHRGLGLIAARAGNLAAAISQLTRARVLRPTDGRIRNDLGYALLLTGRVEEARVELSTAVELDEPSAVPNVLLLLCAIGDDSGARRFVDEHGLDESVERTIREQAEQLRDVWSRDAAPAGVPLDEGEQKPVGKRS